MRIDSTSKIKATIVFPLLAMVFLLNSCIKDELPVEAHNSGNINTNALEMGSDYRYQVFYDLATNKEVSRNVKNIWDLGFETAEDGYRIVLNGSKLMQVYPTGKNSLDEIHGIPSAGWLTDQPTGDMEKTAFGEWGQSTTTGYASNEEVFIIDRGYGFDNDLQGFQKIQILSVDETGYVIRYAKLDGTNEGEMFIEKNDLYNFTFFSFENGGETVMVEPPKADWDLSFTQYTYIFYDIPEASGIPQEELTDTLTYIVNGVLQNRNNTWATEDTLIGFENFQFEDISSVSFGPSISNIGFDWKLYNFDSGIFTVFPEKNYIVKDEHDLYYKIHFIDFYNDLGEKGTPTFEVQAL